MKSSGQIYMDYRQAMRKADELDNIARDLKNLADKDLQETLQNISANWKSDHSGDYLAKGERLGGNMERTSRQISGIASAVRDAARRTYEAEMRAYRIAMARKYHS